MKFALVIVKVPEDKFSGEIGQRYSVFSVYAKLEDLPKREGVLALSDTAWLFDTEKAMSEFALLVSKAAENKIETSVIQFESGISISHVPFSSERASQTVAFLRS